MACRVSSEGGQPSIGPRVKWFFLDSLPHSEETTSISWEHFQPKWDECTVTKKSLAINPVRNVVAQRGERKGEWQVCVSVLIHSRYTCQVLLLSWIDSKVSTCTMIRLLFLGWKCWETAYKDMVSNVERNGAKGGFPPWFFLIITLWGVYMTTVLWRHSPFPSALGNQLCAAGLSVPPSPPPIPIPLLHCLFSAGILFWLNSHKHKLSISSSSWSSAWQMKITLAKELLPSSSPARGHQRKGSPSEKSSLPLPLEHPLCA